jgi:hypothetical protein
MNVAALFKNMANSYDKTLARILPIPPEAVNKKWDSERVRVEAEKWCKPFCCKVQRCLEIDYKKNKQAQCDEAMLYLDRCVKDISAHIQQVISNK